MQTRGHVLRVEEARMATRWDEILQLLDQNKIDHGAGASSREIDDAEAALSVRFPAELREYLTRVGWIAHGMGYYGLGADVPDKKRFGLVENTRWEREEAGPPMQRHLVPILNNGGGDHWCVDTRSGNVVEWLHEFDEDQMPEFAHASLAEWMFTRLTDDVEG
jgi:cell wall assembly regulator SMI1